MSTRKKIVKGAMVLSIGRVSGYGLSFLRNLILARILSKGDFGMAAAVATTVSLLEVTGRLAVGKQIIQAEAGDAESFQAASHSFQFLGGLLSAFLVWLLCVPLARAFHMPSASWAFALVALVPLLRGFEHLDYYRVQRDFRYLPAVLCEAVPQAVVTLAAVPLALWLRSYWVMIWLVIGKAGLTTAMTHFCGRRRYRWSWNRAHLRSIAAFSVPLLFNGFVLFASQQVDQIIVGAAISLEDLAVYALAFQLVAIPWYFSAQVAESLMLPLLSRLQDRAADFRTRYAECLGLAALGAVLFILPLVVAGEQFVTLVFGRKYAGAGPIMALLGVATAFRFLRVAPAVAATARADTLNHLYANLLRSIGLPLALTAALLNGGVLWIASCAVLGEMAALGLSIGRLCRKQGVALGEHARPLCFVGGAMLLGGTVQLVGARTWSLGEAALVVVGLLMLAGVAAKTLLGDAVKQLLGSTKFGGAGFLAKVRSC